VPPAKAKRVRPYAAHGRVKRGKRGFGCLAAICLAVLLAALILGFMLAGFSGALREMGGLSTGSKAEKVHEEMVKREVGVEDKVAIIDIKGVILANSPMDGADANVLRTQLKHAADDPHVVAVVLDLDTPGGEITASDEIYRAVVGVRDAGKPVVACMRSVCASGGYYVAAAADHIIANSLTITGSIGVIIPHFRYSEMLAKIGVEVAPYKSGALKDMLSGATEREAGEQQMVDAYVQSLVDSSFYQFARVVANGRQAYETADDVLNSQIAKCRPLPQGAVADGDALLAERRNKNPD
jgi:protease-4